jgi:hypothetical protein
VWLVAGLLVAAIGGVAWYVWAYFSKPDVTVTAFPQRIHVAESGRTALAAGVSGSSDTDVIWSIQEGNNGGQITPLGVQIEGNQPRSTATYTAPAKPGTFHVIAASHANPSRTATVAIIVGGASQLETTAAPTPAPPSAMTAMATNANAAQILGVWQWPSGEKMTIRANATVAVISDADPSKNLQGTYRFTDNSHVQVDFGNGDVRTWEILGVDGSYLRVLEKSKAGTSPTAIVFAKASG